MMTFAEADAQYELVKQRYQAGALTDEQYDDQLRSLMVLDNTGRWWAKSRENGTWHYYDAATDSWLLGAPPVAAPAAPSRPAAPQPPPAAAGPQTTAGTPVFPAAGNSRGGALPKWAAVAPASVQPPAGDSADQNALPGAAPAASIPASGYSSRDFAPLPELRGSLKIIFFVLALLVPVLGFVFYFVYRNKPAPADRAAARVFLILGVISLALFSLCSVAVVLLESIILGA